MSVLCVQINDTADDDTVSECKPPICKTLPTDDATLAYCNESNALDKFEVLLPWHETMR